MFDRKQELNNLPDDEMFIVVTKRYKKTGFDYKIVCGPNTIKRHVEWINAYDLRNDYEDLLVARISRYSYDDSENALCPYAVVSIEKDFHKSLS